MEQALLTAIAENNLEEAESFLKNGINPDSIGPYGNTAMRNACEADNIEAIKLLLKYGSDINQKIYFTSPVDGRSEQGYRPLFYAHESKTIDYLISQGADINAKSDNGLAPLMIFSEWCDLSCIKTLLKHGADKTHEIFNKNNKPITALVLAEKCLKMWEKINKIDSNEKVLKKIFEAKECIKLLSM